MSLYILPENQKLIWNNLNNLPLFQNFNEYTSIKKDEWFREIIHKFYESNKFKLLSVQELQQLNRDTIIYMLQKIKEIVAMKSVVHPISSSFIGGGQSLLGDSFTNSFTTINPSANLAPINQQNKPPVIQFPSNSVEQKAVTRDYILEQKHEELNKEFSNRQKDYGEMLKRGPQHEINFREIKADEPINNMEELIKQHMAQRDAEMKVYDNIDNGPAKLNNPNITVSIEPVLLKNTEILSNDVSNLENDLVISKHTVRSQKFPFADITNEPPAKNVRWSDNEEPLYKSAMRRQGNTNNNNSNIGQMNMSSFQEFMMEMKECMRTMRQEIDELKRERYGSLPDYKSSQNYHSNKLINELGIVEL